MNLKQLKPKLEEILSILDKETVGCSDEAKHKLKLLIKRVDKIVIATDGSKLARQILIANRPNLKPPNKRYSKPTGCIR